MVYNYSWTIYHGPLSLLNLPSIARANIRCAYRTGEISLRNTCRQRSRVTQHWKHCPFMLLVSLPLNAANIALYKLKTPHFLRMSVGGSGWHWYFASSYNISAHFSPPSLCYWIVNNITMAQCQNFLQRDSTQACGIINKYISSGLIVFEFVKTKKKEKRKETGPDKWLMRSFRKNVPFSWLSLERVANPL